MTGYPQRTPEEWAVKLKLARVGKQWEGPCPKCGGKNRFHVQEGDTQPTVAHCRQCEGVNYAQWIAEVEECTWGRTQPDSSNGLGRYSEPKPSKRLTSKEEPWTPPPPIPESALDSVPATWIATYPTYNKDGDLEVIHGRFKAKKMGDSDPRPWRRERSGLDGIPVTHFSLNGIHLLKDRPEDPVWLTEGEPAADALRKTGVLVVATICGADMSGKIPCPEVLADLAGRDVILWPDRDAVGRCHMKDLSASLLTVGVKSLRILSDNFIETLPQKASKANADIVRNGGDGADAAEWVGGLSDSWGPDEISEELERIAAGAIEREVEPGSEDEDEVLGDWAETVQWASDIEGDASMKIAPSIRFIAFPGGLTLVAAREKLGGKSTLASAGIAAVTRGNPFAGLPTTRGHCLWITEESKIQVKGRLFAQGADLSKVAVTSIGELRRAAIARGLRDHAEALRDLVLHLVPVVYVVDTLDRFRDGIVTDASKSDQWGQVFFPCQDCVRETGTAGVILHHTIKGQGGRYRDSGAIGAHVDIIVEPVRYDKATERPTEWRALGRSQFDFQNFSSDGFDPDTQTMALSPIDTKEESERVKAIRVRREEMRASVLAFIEANPECSGRMIRDGVRGRTALITGAVAELEETGLINKRIGKKNAALWSVRENAR